jgi:hypothetical protein
MTIFLPYLNFLQITRENKGKAVVVNLEAIDARTNRDIEAMSIIFYNIKPLYQTSIEGSLSQEMWNRQQLEYANMAVANAKQLLGKFNQYRMDPDHSVTVHIKRLRQMSKELRSVNSPVPKEVLIMRILQTLPPSFDNFLTFWNNVNLSEQTLTNLTSQLLA